MDKEGIDLNGYYDIISKSNIYWGNESTNFEGNMDASSLDYDYLNQSLGNQSQETLSLMGSKHKTLMVDLIEKWYEKKEHGNQQLDWCHERRNCII